jgi:hypothetical protein
MGRRQSRQRENQQQHDDSERSDIDQRQREQNRADAGHAGDDPNPAVAVAMDQRRPKHLEGIGELEEAKPADGAERDPVQAKIDGQYLPQDRRRRALNEVKQGDDAELALRRRRVPRHAEQAPEPRLHEGPTGEKKATSRQLPKPTASASTARPAVAPIHGRS